MKWLCGRTLVFLALCGLTQVSTAWGGAYDDLLKRLPDTTNAVVVVDVTGLRAALGVTPGTSLMTANMASMPLMASSFVLGAHIDVAERKHTWSIALAQIGSKMTIDDLAKAEGETVEELGGYKLVSSPRGAYFVDLGPKLLGARTPANRPELKRWLAYQKNNQLVGLPPYLMSAVNPDDPALILIAIDLDDSLDPKAVHRGLNLSQVMAARRNADYEGVAKTLIKVKGLTFTARAGAPLNGELTVDFDTDTTAVRYFAKSLLAEILQHAGVYLQDFDDWQPVIKDRSIGLRGTLSLNGLRKIGALVKAPAPPAEAADMARYTSLNPAERKLTSSKRYFKTVTQVLDDLKADKTKSVKGLAGWYDTYADQIDKLSILDVDPDLITFAAATSENLRAMGASLKGISLQSGYLQRQKAVGQVYNAPNYTGNYSAYNAYGGYFGGYGANLANNAALYRSGAAGGVTTVDNFEQIRSQQDALVTQGAAARIALWQRIDDETGTIRRMMTQKYMSEF